MIVQWNCFVGRTNRIDVQWVGTSVEVGSTAKEEERLPYASVLSAKVLVAESSRTIVKASR
jgi:hypothetical protein